MSRSKRWSRRRFLARSVSTVGGLAATTLAPRVGWTAASPTIRVGVIGCGGRGTGAANDCVEAGGDGVKIVALADVFADRLNNLKQKYNVPEQRCFVGLNAYKELLALSDVDMVILATPPGFRPIHFAAAVEAGKHIFAEKPVAVCAAGIRMMLEAAKKSEEKKLCVVAGTQRRHDPKYVETIQRIRDGMIGPIVSAQCYWNQGGLWVRKREPNMTDLEWQLRNWLYFVWLSGDHIVEQHVHNIDVINWAFGTLPDQVHALGGRQYRVQPEYGNIYDHFGTEFFYPGDVRTISMCRQIDKSAGRVSERVVGTKGVTTFDGRIRDHAGNVLWEYKGPSVNPYVQEHRNLLAAMRGGTYINEARQVTESTLCAIMARESAYTRQQMNRKWFMERCDLNLLPPPDLKLTDPVPVAPVAIPGKYQLAGLVQEKKGK